MYVNHRGICEKQNVQDFLSREAGLIELRWFSNLHLNDFPGDSDEDGPQPHFDPCSLIQNAFIR